MSLLDNLLSYYKLDEASGNALDAHGANELTDNNTVGTTTGILSDARDFVAANSEYLNRSNSLNLPGDFSIQLWIKPISVSGTKICGSRVHDGTANTINYLIYMSGSQLWFYIGFTDSTFLQINTSGGLTAGVWNHVVCTHDDTAEQLKIYVNNAAPVAGTYSGKTVATTSLGSFYLGRQHDASFYYNGAIDEVGVWDRVLTAAEVEDLYNSGTGIAYEAFTGPPTPPTTPIGITGYAPTATGDPTLFEYFSAASVGAAQPTASTSIAVTSTPPIGANIALLLMAFDNSGAGADGDYSQITGVTDTKGNSWHKLAEHSNTNGAAGAGATVSVWYCEVDPNTFSSTITTATFSSSIAGRNAAIIYCRSETLSLYAAEILTAATDASTSYGLLSTSLVAKNRMYVRVCAQENETAAGFTPTTGFTTIVGSVQTASGNAMGLRAELKIATSAAETSNPTSSFSSDTASVFIALETDAPGGDGRHTAINTYSMTGVSNAADEVTQVAPVSLGVNSNTADEVTQIATHSLGTNVNTADEVTQIVMYSITSQPIPTPTTTVLGITSFAPTLASGSVTISPVTPPLTTTTFAPVITAQATASVIVPTTVLGITTFEPTPPASMTVTVPTTVLGIVPLVPRILTPGTPGGDDDCCCCCVAMTVTVSVRFSARHSVR